MSIAYEHPNRVFLVKFNGHYLEGQMIVVTSTKRKAFNRAKKAIAEMGLTHKNEDLSMDNVFSFDLNGESVEVIDDGDY